MVFQLQWLVQSMVEGLWFFNFIFLIILLGSSTAARQFVTKLVDLPAVLLNQCAVAFDVAHVHEHSALPGLFLDSQIFGVVKITPLILQRTVDQILAVPATLFVEQMAEVPKTEHQVTRSLTPRFAQVVEELVEVFTRFSQEAERTLTFELLGGNMLTVGAKCLHAELARRILFVMLQRNVPSGFHG